MIRICSVALLLAMLTATAFATTEQQVFHLNRDAERAIGYAQAIRVGDTIYVSGTVARGPTFEEQLAGAYERIGITLDAYGATFADVVKETIYTTDFDALIEATPVRQRYYGSHVPAATWVGIERLYLPDAMLEIEVIAVVGSGAPAPGPRSDR